MHIDFWINGFVLDSGVRGEKALRDPMNKHSLFNRKKKIKKIFTELRKYWVLRKVVKMSLKISCVTQGQDWIFYYLTLFHLAVNQRNLKSATVAWLAKFARLDLFIFFFPCWLNSFLIIDFLTWMRTPTCFLLFFFFIRIHLCKHLWWKAVVSSGYDMGKFTTLKLWII